MKNVAPPELGMQATRKILVIAKISGPVTEIPVCYHMSHQAGVRLYLDNLASAQATNTEHTAPSFSGRSFAEAIAAYRHSIETEGWRLLHAFARSDCWAKPNALGAAIEVLVPGIAETSTIDGFEPAGLDEVTTLELQYQNFQSWMRSLKPVAIGRVRPRHSPHGSSQNATFGPVSVLAGKILGEAWDGADASFAIRKADRSA